LEVAVTKTPALVVALLVATEFVALPASAQAPLSLSQAIARAKAHNPDAGSAAAAEQEAAERVTQARGGYLPKVDVAESWQRGNNPVFVFSSLLAQRQFTAAGFALDALNHPAAMDNFRAALSVEQALFDRTVSANVRAASIGREMASTGRQLVDQDLTSAVTDAFGRVLVLAATARSAAATVEAARADRELAGIRRGAGRVTDADVLQLDVYLTRALEQQVQATADERIARARLNQLMGEPLSTTFSLDLTPLRSPSTLRTRHALKTKPCGTGPSSHWPGSRNSCGGLGRRGASGVSAASGTAQGGWELNGGAWNSRSSSWTVGAVAHDQPVPWLCRLGPARRSARARDASSESKRARPKRPCGSTCRPRLPGSRPRGASEAVGLAAADRARESHRIIRDRYESGLTDTAMLLRAADDVQQADVPANRRARACAHGDSGPATGDRKAMKPITANHHVVVAGVAALLMSTALAGCSPRPAAAAPAHPSEPVDVTVARSR
jgi:hypothetical protein